MGVLDGFVGCLLGTAVGDAAGLPFEGGRAPAEAVDLGSPHPLAEFHYQPVRGYPKGQYSDDTQMSLAIVKAYLRKGRFDGEAIAEEFVRLWRNREIVGEGASCAEAVSNLMSGRADYANSGTPVGRAGNGTAMRAAPVGLWNWRTPGRINEESAIQSRITHQDPRCAAGAAAVAHAVALGVTRDRIDPDEFIHEIAGRVRPLHEEFSRLVLRLHNWLSMEESQAPDEIGEAGSETGVPAADRLVWGGGITPFVVPTVLVALYAFLKSPDNFSRSVGRILLIGGDTDSTAAITGAISGAFNGVDAIPAHLRAGVKDREEIERTAREFHEAACGHGS